MLVITPKKKKERILLSKHDRGSSVYENIKINVHLKVLM